MLGVIFLKKFNRDEPPENSGNFLAKDCLGEVFSYLNYLDRYSCRFVCKHWERTLDVIEPNLRKSIVIPKMIVVNSNAIITFNEIDRVTQFKRALLKLLIKASQMGMVVAFVSGRTPQHDVDMNYCDKPLAKIHEEFVQQGLLADPDFIVMRSTEVTRRESEVSHLHPDKIPTEYKGYNLHLQILAGKFSGKYKTKLQKNEVLYIGDNVSAEIAQGYDAHEIQGHYDNGNEILSIIAARCLIISCQRQHKEAHSNHISIKAP